MSSHTTLTAVKSGTEMISGRIIYETTYQLVIFDAVEGGIEIDPVTRNLPFAASQENILLATVSINVGGVRDFTEWNVLEAENEEEHGVGDSQVFHVSVPRYYYDVMTFIVRRIQ